MNLCMGFKIRGETERRRRRRRGRERERERERERGGVRVCIHSGAFFRILEQANPA
jgi:hypothetical protein